MLESVKKSFVNNAPMIFGLLVASLILWPILDLAFATFVSHAMFHYSVAVHVVRPLLFILLYAIINILADVMSNKA